MRVLSSQCATLEPRWVCVCGPQVPAIQQTFFFWPCAFYLIYALATGAPYYQFPAHGVASLFGQQLRELVLFDSDTMMASSRGAASLSI